MLISIINKTKLLNKNLQRNVGCMHMLYCQADPVEPKGFVETLKNH